MNRVQYHKYQLTMAMFYLWQLSLACVYLSSYFLAFCSSSTIYL